MRGLLPLGAANAPRQRCCGRAAAADELSARLLRRRACTARAADGAAAVAALFCSEMGRFAPATASDGRRAPRLNSPFLASAEGRPAAIRARNKRSICDGWLATSLRLAPRRVPAKRVTIDGVGYDPWLRARRGCGSWGRQFTPSLSDDAALHASAAGAIGIKNTARANHERLEPVAGGS